VWKVVGVSQAGVSHQATDGRCEDAFDTRVRQSDGLLTIAVADGAGSAKHAASGSRYACARALEWLDVGLDLMPLPSHIEVVLREALCQTQNDLTLLSGELGVPVDELACTLVLLVAGPEMCAAAQVGDGSVVVRFGDGEISALLTPLRSEYLNETVFVTSESALSFVQFAFTELDVAELAVMTDGLQSVAMNLKDDTPFQGFFEPIFRFASGRDFQIEPLAEFLSSPRLVAETDDDRTLVLAARATC
jgi:hypothetical protein